MSEYLVLAVLAARQVLLLEAQMAEARAEIESLKAKVGPREVEKPAEPAGEA